MDIDLSKKLCDATLGEFIAAERSAAILASWVLAATTVGLGFVGRALYRRWKRNRIPNITPDLPLDDHGNPRL